jgi:formylglycine-generating enzyme required for sulfatase activity
MEQQGADATPPEATPAKPSRNDPILVFIAAPGDMEQEVALACREVNSYAKQHASLVEIRLVAWSVLGDGIKLETRLGPQAAIDRGLPRPAECDIVIALFGNRMGTPLSASFATKPDGSQFRSGTEYEFLTAHWASLEHGRPSVLLYRCEKPFTPSADPRTLREEMAQIEAVTALVAEFRNPDGSHEHNRLRAASLSELRRKLTTRLGTAIEAAIRLRIPERQERDLLEQPWDGSPFPGFASFERDQWPIFRGRDEVADDLMKHLLRPAAEAVPESAPALADDPGAAAEAQGAAAADPDAPAVPAARCLALFGASGSGKSSVIKAGVLRRFFELHSSRHWPIAELTPGIDPLRKLAGAIKTACGGHRLHYDEDRQAAVIAQGGWDALRDAALSGCPGEAALVIFIDQFEELFTLTPDGSAPGTEDRRSPFLRWLETARADPRVRLLLTARDDFYHRFNADPVLRSFLGEDHFHLPAADHAARMRMVVEPVRRARLSIEPELAERIARDTGDDPGALPFMAYALARLYQHEQARGSETLTNKGYDDIGKVQDAVIACADAVYQGFAAEFGQDGAGAALEQLFVELVWVDDKGTAARRAAPRERLADAPPGQPSAAELARRLEHPQARLLTGDKEADGTPVIQVAHEALLRVWPPVVEWVKRRADDLTRYRWLQESAARWAEPANPEREAPYSSAHLQSDGWVREVRRALANLSKTLDDLKPHERAFLDPDARARLLLQKGLDDWRAGGRDAAGLWTPDRFAACAGAGRLPEQDGDTRAFLRASFDASLAAAAQDAPARARMGLTLAGLGDPRFDAGHWHLPADETLGFIEIPPGELLMGTDPKADPYGGFPVERPQHRQSMARAYWIGRYPVTIGAYRRFVEEAKYKDAVPQALQGPDSNPVSLVSLIDARAYCAWLEEHCLAPIAAERAASLAGSPAGLFWAAVAAGEVRAGLPSEPEWERAARGDDGRIFPWGGDCRPELANYLDTGLQTAAAVGCFPAGRSPFGCEDMAGNVWEWTRSLWGPSQDRLGFSGTYPYAPWKNETRRAKPRVWRVLRGGSFGNSSYDLRCAMRDRYGPGLRNGVVGFRVAWSPFL